jgi:hypothetical protein
MERSPSISILHLLFYFIQFYFILSHTIIFYHSNIPVHPKVGRRNVTAESCTPAAFPWHGLSQKAAQPIKQRTVVTGSAIRGRPVRPGFCSARDELARNGHRPSFPTRGG